MWPLFSLNQTYSLHCFNKFRSILFTLCIIILYIPRKVKFIKLFQNKKRSHFFNNFSIIILLFFSSSFWKCIWSFYYNSYSCNSFYRFYKFNIFKSLPQAWFYFKCCLLHILLFFFNWLYFFNLLNLLFLYFL